LSAAAGHPLLIFEQAKLLVEIGLRPTAAKILHRCEPLRTGITDAYERRIYANYQWISRPNKKYWEVPPSTCELIPSLKDKRHCNSREEFDAFVADYMEE
jgi:hypothetical protein